MYCKFCGKQVNPGTVNCPYCGHQADALSGGSGFWDLTMEKPAQSDLHEVETPHSIQAPIPEPLPEKNTSTKRKSTGLLVLAIVIVLTLQCIALLKIVQIASTYSGLENKLDALRYEMNQLTEYENQSDLPTSTNPEITENPYISQDTTSNINEGTDAYYMQEFSAIEYRFKIDVALSKGVNGVQLDLCANVEPEGIIESDDQIKWWKGDSENDAEQLREGNVQATGQNQYYVLASAGGDITRYLYFTIELEDGTEYQSEPVYVLNEVVSVEIAHYGTDAYLIPVYMNGFETLEEDYQGYWLHKTVDSSDDSSEWVPLQNENGEYVDRLPLAEMEASCQYRFIVQSADQTILGLVDYNGGINNGE